MANSAKVQRQLALDILGVDRPWVMAPCRICAKKLKTKYPETATCDYCFVIKTCIKCEREPAMPNPDCVCKGTSRNEDGTACQFCPKDWACYVCGMKELIARCKEGEE